MPPRPSRTDTTSADAVAVTGGSFASPDKLYDLSVKVGSIERSITYLEGHAESARTKLESISTEITSAKAMFGTLKFLFIAICVGTWGLISALIVVWAKHHFNW